MILKHSNREKNMRIYFSLMKTEKAKFYDQIWFNE